MINGQCQDKGLNFDCRITGLVDDYYIGDDTKLRQVLSNVLDNAIKFIKSVLKPDDLLLTMGAGDVYKIGEKFLREN